MTRMALIAADQEIGMGRLGHPIRRVMGVTARAQGAE